MQRLLEILFGATREGAAPGVDRAIDFNPPDGVINHNVSGVGPTTRPFTDVTTDGVGNFAGTMVAQGHGLSGSNVDYVRSTHEHLLATGIVDPALSFIADHLPEGVRRFGDFSE